MPIVYSPSPFLSQSSVFAFSDCHSFAFVCAHAKKCAMSRSELVTLFHRVPFETLEVASLTIVHTTRCTHPVQHSTSAVA